MDDLFSTEKSFTSEVREFITEWNSRLWLPKITGTPRQAKIIREFLQRPYSRENWREAIKIMVRCKWLREKMRPRFSIDWFLVNDNFDKIMEGKYLDQSEEVSNTDHAVKREGDDEWIQ